MSPLRVTELGRRPYSEVWALQRELVDRRANGEIPDTLLLVEHEPVITLGRGTARDDVLAAGTPIFEVERGGAATYHAPGQLVGYPILKLEGPGRDLHRLLRSLEEVQIVAIARWGLVGRRVPGKTGVWVGDHKIASLGIAVRRWVTYHGFALNVNTDLRGFRAIRPCGMPPQVMTSMQELLGEHVPLAEVGAELAALFGRTWRHAT